MDNKFVLSQSFNEIVFEKRNKKYGAYDIRRKYTRYALAAGACAILFFTCGSLTWAYVQTPEKQHRYTVTDVTLSSIKPVEDIPKKNQQELPKAKQQPQAAVTKGVNVPTQTTVVDIVEDPVLPPSDLGLVKGDTAAVATIPGIPGGPGDCLDCPQVDTTPKIKIVEWSLYPPTCDELDAYLTSSIRYPDICREQGIEGTVFVEFIVDTKGNYRDVKVVKGPHPALNKEALRVMSAMPKWTPAKDDKGELVEYIMRKPIRFALSH